MISRIAAIMILVALLSQNLIKSIVLVNYEVNKTTIIKNYCENKAKPKMHCDGKCHLKKQLKKEEKREKSPLSQNTKEQYEVQYFAKIEMPTAEKGLFRLEKHRSAYSFSLSTSSPGKIFQPPKC